MRTLGSFNHPGPDEEPTAILLTSSPKGSGAGDPSVGSPARAATRVGLFLMEHPHCSDSHQYKEPRVARRLEPCNRLACCHPSRRPLRGLLRMRTLLSNKQKRGWPD